ncbi:hypothetical protein BDW74DRAFT_168249 [Aspergillus multicolor]|uniref:oxygenase MpaB family protein n=1 Tax=Aspergillus multicolor TaxID=41759 RepID=UPI003CCD3A10
MAPYKLGDKVTVCNYTFTWTEKHLSKEQLEPLRYQHDTLADLAMERIQSFRREDIAANAIPTKDNYEILREHHQNDPTLAEFWTQTHTVPDWMDWDQLAKGFVYRYALANFASPGVAEIFVRTGSFSTRVLLPRLLETLQWLLQITHDIISIQPGGEGHIATLRVRLLHATLRKRILQLASRKPGYYDVVTHGVPVNVLDSLHSMTGFSCSPMWLQLLAFGIEPSAEERDGYIALFRYIAYLLGVPTSPFFETPESAKCVMESILTQDVTITATSRVIAFNFLQVATNLPKPFYVSLGFAALGSRAIYGDTLSDELELPRPGLVHTLAFHGFCVLVWVLAWLQRCVPGVDTAIIRFWRDILYEKGVVNREKSRFEFKYIPEVGRKTEKEVHASTMGGTKGRGLFGTDVGHAELVFLGVLVGAVVMALVLLVAAWMYVVGPSVAWVGR